MKIIYNGHRNPALIKVGSLILWNKGEVKEIEDSMASKLLKNSEFKLAKEVKTEVKVEKSLKFDLNDNGIEGDDEDLSIAGQTLAFAKKQKKNK